MPPMAVNSLPKIVANLRTWLMGILAGVATLFLTIGGVRYVMAGGDPSEVERAKAAFRSAGIGYALAVIAPVVLSILQSIIGTP
jgi:Type IV secretion system pilin